MKLGEGNVFAGVCLSAGRVFLVPSPFRGRGGYVQGVGDYDSEALTPPPPPRHGTWDTTGYGRQAVGTHPTGMLSCFIRFDFYCYFTR